MTGLPIIDMTALFDAADANGRARAAREIAMSCTDHGFFYVTGHGISETLLQQLDCASRRFFALPEARKAEIAMRHGGRAWRGWFPVGGELTSGMPDMKEGLYFGSELGREHPAVRRQLPLHGANLFPADIPELKPAVLDFMATATRAAHALMEGIALSLGLDAMYFHDKYTREPTILFRVFHYPNMQAHSDAWGVGEHTDYGLLTLLAQDDAGGLEVRARRGWIDVPPLRNTLVCNIGDMLDRLTGGYYRSTPHRVRNISGRSRLSFPFFFDPGFEARIEALPERTRHVSDDRESRWDRASVHAFSGTYGEYLLAKVSKVFPELHNRTIR